MGVSIGTALGDTLRVAVASNFAPTLERLAAAFERETGDRLVLSPGATGKHFAQILHGAPFDVFLAADAERPARLESKGLAAEGRRFTYALGRLVLWSSDPGLIDGDATTVLAAGGFDPR